MRGHDLVGRLGLEHAVLVDAGGMREGVAADHGLVGLHRHRTHVAHQPARAHELGGVDAAGDIQVIAAHVHDHHDLFEGGVARALADAVDGAFHLARAVPDRGDGIRGGEAQVVVAVDRDDRLVDVGHAVEQVVDDRGEDLGRGVADGVGNVDRAGPVLDGGLDHLAQKVALGAAGVLGRELHVAALAARQLHRLRDHGQDLALRAAQLLFAVNGRGAEEGVDAGPLGRAHGRGARQDVLVDGAGQAANDGPLDLLGDGLDRDEVAGRRNGKSRFDDVDLELRELARDADLLSHRQAGRQGLFAVAQGRIENQDVVFHGYSRGSPVVVRRSILRIFHHRERRERRGRKQKGFPDPDPNPSSSGPSLCPLRPLW